MTDRRRAGEAAGAQQDWRVVTAIFTSALFLEMIAWGQLNAFTPLYLQEVLHVPTGDVPRWVGVLASASMLIAVPLSLFWGVLADRYSRKWMILRSEFLQVACYGLTAFAGDVWSLLAARLLFGFTFGNTALMMATQSIVTPQREVGWAIGVVQMASPIALSIGPLIGSALIKLVGLRAMFGIDAGLALASALLMVVFLKEPPRQADVHASLARRLRIVLVQVAAVPAIRWNFVLTFLVAAGIAAAQPYIPVVIERASRSAGVDAPTAIGLILGGFAFLSALATPLLGRLAGRIGTTRIMLLSMPLLALIFFGISWATSLTAIAVLVLLRALPQTGANSLLYVHLAEVSPAEHRSALMSLSPTPRNVAMLVAPAVASIVSGWGIGAVFQYIGLCSVLATAAAFLMHRSTLARQPVAIPAGTGEPIKSRS